MQTQKKNAGRNQIRTLVLFVVSLCLLLAIFVVSIYIFQLRTINIDVGRKVEEAQRIFNSKLTGDKELLSGFSDFIQKETGLREAWLSRDRSALFAEAFPLFEDLRSKYNITHFYFMDLSGVCFLRVHNPRLFKDVITRFTMEQAKLKMTSSYGVELGPLGTFTIRSVRPWVINGKPEGYVELGKEIGHIVPELRDALGIELIFIIDKFYLEREKWKEGLDILGRTGDWDQFSDFVVTISTISKVSKKTGEQIRIFHKKGGGAVFKIREKGCIYRGGFVPLVDARGQDVGDMLVLKDTTRDEAPPFKLLIISVAMSFAICIVPAYFLSIRFRTSKQ
jgi:hypothetical protein